MANHQHDELTSNLWGHTAADHCGLPGLGDKYRPPAEFRHGEWELVAEIPPGDHGQRVKVYEQRSPTPFFRLEALERTIAGEGVMPGFVMETGSGVAHLVAELAQAVADGVIELIPPAERA